MTGILIAVIAALAAVNLGSFLLMGYDKACAKQNKRRVSGKALFLAAGLFGAFGGTLGMFVFRHKTKHWYFRIFFPLMLVLQAAILGYAWTRIQG